MIESNLIRIKIKIKRKMELIMNSRVNECVQCVVKNNILVLNRFHEKLITENYFMKSLLRVKRKSSNIINDHLGDLCSFKIKNLVRN
jgi:hypothetical protein